MNEVNEMLKNEINEEIPEENLVTNKGNESINNKGKL